MHAHIEPIAGVVRIFENERQWGDPFVWSCTIRWRNITEVELLGVTKPPTATQMRALIKTLQRAGITAVIIKRRGLERRKTLRSKEAKGDDSAR